MVFPYKENNGALRPVIPVVLSYGGKSIDHEVLIDSGADHCFFDAEIGEALGLEGWNEELHEAFGIGGNRSSYYSHTITITVGNKSRNIEAGFMPYVGGGIVNYGFAGQKGFFDWFVIKFDRAKNQVYLKENKN